ncbi:MAG: DEAD/DEAH box helicase [Clostridiales Family XIII bacterium]|jgi:superfamily II DNA or RNA helicase|nr:DEAD/DEAH box helicase [Clostridiales Family XIII bacterium]
MVTLRPYQEEAVTAIHNEWDSGIKKTLLVLPTGAGKTITFSKVIENVVTSGERALILAHRGELLDQAADKLKKTTGLTCAVEKAENSASNSLCPVTVGSVQSLMREKRLAKFPKDYYKTIVVDEAHHILSKSYQSVLDYFHDAKVLGVTATPDRGDKKNLGQYFETLAYEYTLPKAIKEGYLCKIEAQTIPLKLDLTSVSTTQGDFNAAELGSALDPFLEQIADEMLSTGCMQRKTVVFLPLIATAQKFMNVLNDKGFKAAEVNGTSKDREEILEDFNQNRYNVLCNAMLLTEGWDQPDVNCIVMLRPTKIRSLYCQCVGRGTRIHPGKDSLLLLDFLWHVERHELCHPAHLIAESDDIAKKMTELIEDADGVVDLEDIEEQAASDVLTEREEALAKLLKEMTTRKRKLVDPIQFEMSIQAEDLVDYVPSFGWEMAPPSEKQLEALEKKGIFSDEIECAGKAAKLLDKLHARQVEGLSTPKQIRLLEKKGFKHVGTWEFAQAQKLIGEIAANGWRVPYHIDPFHYIPEPTMKNVFDEFEPFVNNFSHGA